MVSRSGLEPLADPLDRYLREVSINKKGRDYSINQSQVRQICMYPISLLPITRIRPADIARYRDARLTDTKNGESREVLLSSRALATLKSLPRQLHDERIFGLTDDAISTMMARVCKRTGIENLRFHDLRHEATSRHFEKGLNPMQVAAITGHKTLQMLKRYTHLRAEDLARMPG